MKLMKLAGCFSLLLVVVLVLSQQAWGQVICTGSDECTSCDRCCFNYLSTFPTSCQGCHQAECGGPPPPEGEEPEDRPPPPPEPEPEGPPERPEQPMQPPVYDKPYSPPHIPGYEDLFDMWDVKEYELNYIGGAWPQEGKARFGLKNASDSERVEVFVNRKDQDQPRGDNYQVKLTVENDELWYGQMMIMLHVGDTTGVLEECFTWMLHVVAWPLQNAPYTVQKAHFIALYVEGEFNGVYCHIEKEDKTFMVNRGIDQPESENWLCKGNHCDLRYGTNFENNEVYNTIGALYIPKARDVNDTYLYELIEPRVNTDQLLTYAAVSTYIGSDEDMWNRFTSNELWHIDSLGKKRIYMSNDNDESFYKSSCYTAPGSEQVRPITNAYLYNFRYRQKYNKIIVGLFGRDGVFSARVIDERISVLKTKLQPYLDRDEDGWMGESGRTLEDIRVWLHDQSGNFLQCVALNEPPPRERF